MSANPARIPAQAQGTDQFLAGTNDASSHIEQHMRIAGGVAPAATTGSITTATSTVTSGDVGILNNVTVVITGTYAGVNVTFEVSPDAGTTWVPIAGTRLDGTGVESTSGVLTANTTRAWEFTLPAVNRFRVRATAWTSGTASIIINAGSMPLEPLVSAILFRPPSYIQKSWTAAGVAYAGTTEAAASLTPITDAASAAAATTFTVPTGKTWRVQGLWIAVTNGAATANTMTFNLRAVPTGTAANTSPVLWSTQLVQPATAAAITGMSFPMMFGPDGLDLKSGWNFGLFNIASGASAGTTIRATIWGYEF